MAATNPAFDADDQRRTSCCDYLPLSQPIPCVSVHKLEIKKGRLATAFWYCFKSMLHAYWGTVTVVASRTTADCASILPESDARFPNVIDV